MRYYLRWWMNGKEASPVKVADEATARAEVQKKYPAAYFGSWHPTLNNPSASFKNLIDDQMGAWENSQAHANSRLPIADILRGDLTRRRRPSLA